MIVEGLRRQEQGRLEEILPSLRSLIRDTGRWAT